MGEIKTAKDAVEFIKKEGIEIVDFRFMDFPGLWQHFSTIPREVDEKVFEEGLGFDGSSIRGWQAINESDMLVKPVSESAFVDPFFKAKTLVFICNICDPVTGEDYTRDPRNIARKAENYMKSLGLADTAYFGPEAEFFIFDDIRFDQNQHEGYYHINSVEGRWNTGKAEEPNLGYKPRYKEGYFPVPPTDSLQDISGFKSGNGTGNPEFVIKGLVGIAANDDRNMSGQNKSVDADIRSRHQGFEGRRYEFMGRKNKKIIQFPLSSRF